MSRRLGVPRPLPAALAAALAIPLVVIAPGEQASAGGTPDVRISELANGGPGGTNDDFLELTNYGDAEADLTGWWVFRCSGEGAHVSSPQVPPLDGVRLAPGESYLITRSGNASTIEDPDARYDVSFNNNGFGVYLEDAEHRMVDSVGVYPAHVHSDCAQGANIPNTLDYKRAQSWQRVSSTGNNAADFIAARRTPGAPNATTPDEGARPGDVLFSEVANGGPGGTNDDFVELANFGDEPVDITGWSFYRCTATGRRDAGTRQLDPLPEKVLQPGETYVISRAGSASTVEDPDARYGVSFNDAGFGALLEDADGAIVDAVSVYDHLDSACAQGERLPNTLDYGYGESYQRHRSTGDNRADFVKAPRTPGELVIHDPEDLVEEPFEFGPVRISEFANAGPGGTNDDFVEIANYGDEPVSIDGWSLHRCAGTGRRVTTPQFTAPAGTTLAPGETFLAARAGSELADVADTTYPTSLNDDGYGVWLQDADERLVDAAGAYVRTADFGYQDVTSPCVLGLALHNSLLTSEGESYQRARSTGDNVADFAKAPRTPGELVTPEPRDPAVPDPADLEPVELDTRARPWTPELGGPADGAVVDRDAELTSRVHHPNGDTMRVSFRGAPVIPVVDSATKSFSGATSEAPPSVLRVPGEERVGRPHVPGAPGAEPLVSEDRSGDFPFQRFELVVGEHLRDVPEFHVSWSGRSSGRNELQLRAWDHRAGQWTLLDAGAGVDGEEIGLLGRVDVSSMVRGRTVNLLVQDGPRTGESFGGSEEPNQEFANPHEYDFSVAHVTDTQFLAEDFREAYTAINSWLVANQEARKIDYSFHTGDIIETWIRGVDREERARHEFEFASDAQRLLDDAGLPNGILPGNHDNKWGLTNDLYNEYFGPDRYEDKPWWGGSWREGDNSSHYDLVEAGGLDFLMLSVGYFADPEEIAWARRVIEAHPDHNVILGTHEYLRPEGERATRENGRWTAQGDVFWDELVEPHDNVFLVLSGHFHGVSTVVQHEVGDGDRTVVEMLADYQAFEVDGQRRTGFLRLLQFDADAGRMAVNTYSPSLGEHNSWEYDGEGRYGDADDEFVLDVDLLTPRKVETTGLGLLGPVAEIGTVPTESGREAALEWSGLREGTRYAWFAEVSDAEGVTARSAVRGFTTSGGR
ncbi:lamin tail domain-containing protein [Actinoalloteichus caeruleus]|uniref:Calcineurin-like phosphoesterase n=1 Tax=Actinoalloteichus caeruleus DSM 43889 TaxID=1120930 RepID=A0ABT1JBC3_ACTCY|nr:lamin tail domain-containing protein [Actinoalloteichus caeruleus]MCP2329805.1 Calcineurin-like phosphoesterase [Actinoalloteichus caeruleus DSM 43889]